MRLPLPAAGLAVGCRFKPPHTHGCMQVQRTEDSEALLDHYGIAQVPTLVALTSEHRKLEYPGGCSGACGACMWRLSGMHSKGRE